jgi:hypothetical protein
VGELLREIQVSEQLKEAYDRCGSWIIYRNPNRITFRPLGRCQNAGIMSDSIIEPALKKHPQNPNKSISLEKLRE